MKRGDIYYQYSEKVICVKWKDNRGVVLVGSNIDGPDDSSSVQRREKGNSSKTSFPCPQLVKSYNKGMGGADLLDQLTFTYRLDRKSKNSYYLRLFFDLWDMALVNSYIVYSKLTQNKLSHYDFNVAVAKGLIGNYNSRKRNPLTFRPTKRSSSNFPTEIPLHLPELEPSRGRCHYCKNEGKENRTFIKCNTCVVFLCLVASASGRNCFYKHHLKI